MTAHELLVTLGRAEAAKHSASYTTRASRRLPIRDDGGLFNLYRYDDLFGRLISLFGVVPRMKLSEVSGQHPRMLLQGRVDR